MIRKKTKIIATLGPATATKETILSLIREGVNAFRINFSHAKYEQIKIPIAIIKDINSSGLFPYKIGIIADLQGPKIRVGAIAAGTRLKRDQTVAVRCDQPFEGDQSSFFINYESLAKDAEVGDKILINDAIIINI